MIRQLMNLNGLMNLRGLFLGGTAAVAALGLAPAASAGTRVDLDVSFGRSYPAHYEQRVTRVWVPAVYRTVCDRVWVEPVYRTVCDKVWIEPVYQTVGENVWVPDRWEDRTVVRQEGWHRVYRTEHVLVEAAHWARVDRQVVVQPGRWDTVERQELVSLGHFQTIERQEVVAPGHWEDRVERVAGPDWRPAPLPGWDIRVSHDSDHHNGDRHEDYRH